MNDYYTFGWRKTQSAGVRRRKVLASRPSGWTLSEKRLSSAKALTVLANVTTDRRTKELARRDAAHFYKVIRVRKKKIIKVRRSR